MADGFQGGVMMTAATPTLVATAPTSGSVFNIMIANQSSLPTTVTVYASTATVAGALTTANVIVSNRTVPPYGEYEKNGVVMSAAENVWVNDVNGTCSVQVRGYTG